MQSMNEITINTGFITPDNMQIEVPIMEMGNFCRKYCLEYASRDEVCNKTFNDFAKDYTYFKPYLEFLISELGWIQFGTTLDPKGIYCNMGKKNPVTYNIGRLGKNSSLNLYDYIIKTIRQDCYHLYPLYSCCDASLKIRHGESSIDSCGYIMNDGVFIDAGISHEIVGTSILQAILLECGGLLENYCNKENHDIEAEDYLIQKLGVIKVDYYKPISIYYVSNLMSEKQKMAIYDLISKKCLINEEQNIHDLEKTKKLIREYNSR